MKRAYIKTPDGITSIQADEMDRDGDHVVFLLDGNLVGVVKMENIIDAHLTGSDEKQGERQGNGNRQSGKTGGA